VKTVLISAPDASGDLHAAACVRELRARRPELRFVGLGGVALEKAGVELAVAQRELAVGGLFEVLRSAGRIVRAWRRMKALIAETRPDLVILVDAPDFNLPLARVAKRAGAAVLYYICPQVWAWRRRRLRKLARRSDHLAVIFPFEVEVFRRSGRPVDFVGHPLVETLAEWRASCSRGEARRLLGLHEERPTLLLLPGSRRNEIKRGLPLMLAVARVLHARDPRLAFLLAVAPTLERAEVERLIAAQSLPSALQLSVVEGRSYEAMRAADVVLAKPGTSTLEAVLLERPLVVVGRANPLTAALARRVLHVSYLAMPNLIAGAPVVPEFLQQAAEPERVADAVQKLFLGPARAVQLEQLVRVRESLGSGGAAPNVAAIADGMLG